MAETSKIANNHAVSPRTAQTIVIQTCCQMITQRHESTLTLAQYFFGVLTIPT